MAVNRLARKPMLVALFTLLLTNGLVLARQQRAVPRGGGGDGGGGSSAPPAGARPSAGAPEPRSAPSGGDSSSQPSSRSGSSNADSSNGPSSSSDPVSYGRPRGGNQVTGNAVARTGPPPISGGGSWGGGYYPAYPYYPYYPYHYANYYPYYPWGYGGFGFGVYYYGGYDPWWYGYPGGGYSLAYSDDGSLRLKIKPNNASVFVDGYYAGRVDDFDNPFQSLHLEAGPHRIEVRGDGLETLSFDVRILPGRDITYSGELKRD